MTPWTLVVERQHWRDKAPGLSTCVELSATQDYYTLAGVANGSYVPNGGDDDATANFTDATIDLAAVVVKIGNDGTHNLGFGVCFNNVTIPAGATILSAQLDLLAHAAGNNDDCNAIILGDKDVTPATFTTYVDYTNRVAAGTTAHVHWDIIRHWAAGTHYYSPDISLIIQEIINLPGWASGNDLAIFVNNNASTVGALREPVSLDHGALQPPTLRVTWAPVGAATGTFGRVATCANEVYVANKHNQAQLTHIFIEDGGIFPGGNLIGAARPFAFLPAVPVAGDCVYFGCTGGPFCSIVFDILAAVTGINNIDWLYYNGAFNPLTNYRDNTNANGAGTGIPFDTIGVNSIHWIQPSDWTPSIVNGVSAYWIRAEVGPIVGALVAPTQQNRDIYTIVTPYVDTLATQVPGDITALAELLAEGQSGQPLPKPVILAQTAMYAGLRSYDRGANFTSFLNLADEQNPVGITVTVNGGTATFATDVTSPSGRVVDWTTGGALAEAWLAYITIPTALADDFTGEFRCFMRLVVQSGNPQDMFYRLKTCLGTYTNTIYQTVQKSPNVGGGILTELLDFGKITLPPAQNDNGETFKNTIIRIDGQAVNVGVHGHLFDIIIMPCDKCFIETNAFSAPDVGVGTFNDEAKLNYQAGEWKRLDIDSTIPRRMIKSDVQNITGYTITPWANKINGPLIWQPNERQRWWFLQKDVSGGIRSSIVNSLSLQAFKVSRYLSMRGKR